MQLTQRSNDACVGPKALHPHTSQIGSRLERPGGQAGWESNQERIICKPPNYYSFLSHWHGDTHRRKVSKVLKDALGKSATWQYLGLDGTVDHFVIPPLGAPVDVDENQRVLWIHFRNTMEHVKQLTIYALHYTTPPYSFLRLIREANQSKRDGVMKSIKAFWELILTLESSQDIFHRRCLKVLCLRRLTVVREVCNLLQQAGWKMTHQISEYISATAPGMLHTMAHEAYGNNWCRTFACHHRCDIYIMWYQTCIC